MTNTWIFPQKDTLFFRIEIFFVFILAVLIFLYTALQFDVHVFSGIAFALLFMIIYGLISYGTKKVRKVELTYKTTKTHLHITKKINNQKKQQDKIHLKLVQRHKLDRIFLGGYLIMKNGKKFVLFFNTKNEMDKFEKNLKKHLKLKKKK